MIRKFLPLLGVALVAWFLMANGRDARGTSMPGEYNPLTPAEEKVIVHKGTERAFSGMYHDHKESGLYVCKRCDAPLFRSDDKFDSRTGWPSFDDAIPGAVKQMPDGSRTEIVCANCGGHLGHVFFGEGFTEKNTRHCVNSVSLNFVPEDHVERAIFAGGCFWGVEHHLKRVPGVQATTVGFIDGRTEHPSYKDVSYKSTGHAEAVEVVFDNSKVSFETLAKLFFEIHDPTQLNRQGPDIGTQYRSAVYYTNDAQRETANELIGILEEKGLDVATQVVEADSFWPAEEYHQDYYDKTGKQPYCHTRVKRF